MCHVDLKPVGLRHIGIARDKGRFLFSVGILFIPDGSNNECIIRLRLTYIVFFFVFFQQTTCAELPRFIYSTK